MTRIAVLVSGGGTNLQALIDAQEAGRLKSGILCLVIASKPGAGALDRARRHGIPAAVVARGDCAGQEEFERRISALLAEYRIELIVLAGFMSILSGDFTRAWPRRIINVHPALIPAFSGKGCYGLRVHQAVLDCGVKMTGATVHFVNEIPDGGEIIAQKAVPVRRRDTPETLQRRVMEQAEWKLLPRAVEQVARAVRKEKGRV
ncbi:MAG: phosphoribosylglycinamide formyltransferase [Clostridiales bacterium]|nr:phosphoribosylglycinamide formyltransferase [Clostridiales bacterium]